MPALEWIGKQAVVRHHLEVPYRILAPVPELSYGEGENLLVEGDNLEALKALLPEYRGRVRLIYIDPPYNTGNEGWVYNDNVSSPEIQAWLKKAVGPEAEDLSRHDKWLSMMYPRLRLLHELLREDGSLWMSIDDNEVHRARMLLDEIFGPQNFVATVVWERSDSPRMDASYFSVRHDYVLVYAKNKPFFRVKRLRDNGGAPSHYNRIDEHGRRYYLKPLRAMGQADRREDRPSMYYPIEAPDGSLVYPQKQDGSAGRWRWSREKLLQKQHLLEWVRGPEGWTPYYRIYYAGDQGTERPPETIWFHTEVGSNRTAAKETKEAFGGQDLFDTPKPLGLLQRILQIATNPHDGDIVLDSFAGSGTTGHAVLKQNAEDGGNRRFILVELDPRIAQNITRKRLEYAARTHGGGFRYLRLGEPLFTPDGRIREGVDYLTLARYVYYRETGEPLPETFTPPLLGVSQRGVAVYLLYNGVLKDKSPKG
ncbi:site-specific DNA-methyltransferase [Thermus thermophilus]|uniref:site-specific DNA-methyltransferase n=1 Tax=Thermus thermophilus TaxID=274 RepID=UPI000BBA6C6B|nr:site-specific DNA-methyltransferase [Thermus thermophilus]BDB12225.1 hypothetical protein TthTMY_19640 [Thermus thermophilus]